MISLQQIKQRKLVQWALAYLAGAWLVLQLADFLADAYAWPPVVLRVLTVAAGVGLLAVLVLAWYHGERGAQRVAGLELLMLAGILLIGGVGVAMVRDKPASSSGDVAMTTKPAIEQGSIAVLPFADMSPGGDQAYFSDGLSEELLNVLAQIPELRVAARTSSFSFRGSNAAIDSIGRALRVEYVLEGSVRTAGENVRITAQLIKAADGFHVWSKTYDRSMKDVLAVQDEISRAIVDALRLKLGAASTTATAGSPTVNPEAHALVLKAVYELRQSGVRNADKALGPAREAVRLDPNYARAHAVLGRAYWETAYDAHAPRAETYALAEQHARRALQLDPNNAEAYLVLGITADVHHGKFAEAEQHLKRAGELNPALGEVHSQRAWLLVKLGRIQEAIAEAQHAALVDPMSPMSHNTLGYMYLAADRPQEALHAFNATVAIGSEGASGLTGLSTALLELRRYDEAIAAARRLEAQDPDNTYGLAILARAHALAGQRAEAEAILKRMLAIDDVRPSSLAAVYVALGNHDEAFRQLDRAIAERDDHVSDNIRGAEFAAVRNDPRMAGILKRLGLPAS